VFAQAREKARQATCLSNLKQLALGVLMYQQDNDEYYPVGENTTSDSANAAANDFSNWQVTILPYLKSFGVYGCPDDSGAGQPSPVSAGQGTLASYAANGYNEYKWNGTSVEVQCGPMPLISGGENGAPMKDSQVTRPSDSILLAEVYSSDLAKSEPTALADWHQYWMNTTAYGWATTITGLAWCDGGLDIPWSGGGTQPNNDVPGWPNVTTGSDPYMEGVYGATIPHHAGNQLANFAFCDGHVKSMNPINTDLDNDNTIGSTDSTNLWDATR
jgi:prepilin-type processing-associated H-X9-DG protein